jgi:hypothetical protein
MKEWLLLLHQIPPHPPYFRAKVMRRLNQLGALAIKNSAYLLPFSEDAVEDFEWLSKEISEEGGEAWVFRCHPLAGDGEKFVDAFRKQRAVEFAALAEECRSGATPLKTVKRRFEELARIDFFGAPGREEVEKLMIESGQTASEYSGRTWVTRKGVKVDRMSSAWLIRRFIDPAAKFKFVDPQAYRHTGDEVRFDMFEGEFTHQGDLCTFEVLARMAGALDPALKALGEIVHDLDLKDAKYQRSEAAGISLMIEGIVARHSDDARRLEDGTILFEALYGGIKP